MNVFVCGHASHPDWRQATEDALAQLGPLAPLPDRQPLGLLYLTAPLAPHSAAILQLLQSRTGLRDWVGTCGAAIMANEVEYSHEPALALMVAWLPSGSFQVFSGTRPPAVRRHTHMPAHALIHADPQTPDLADLVRDMAGKIDGGLLFGGLSSGQVTPLPQFARDILAGGLSGVVLEPEVTLLSRVTQACTPLAREHVISDCQANLIRSLDGLPALDVLLADLGVDALTRSSRDSDTMLRALSTERIKAGLMLGLARPHGSIRKLRRGLSDYLIRDLIGIDPQNRLLAVAAVPTVGDQAIFCTRDAQAARADLIRICTELRDEIETDDRQALGAIYVSCVARGQALFGAPAVEATLIQSHLGPLPCIGFFANGEIYRDHIDGYTGVLTVFTAPRQH